MDVLARLLPYASLLEARSLGAVDLIVVHCTELPDLAAAREYAERIHYRESGTGNAGHFYIDRNGAVEQWVPENRVAHHVRGFNDRSIGVELVNRGRFPDWYDSNGQSMSEPYPPGQIDSLIALVRSLSARLPRLAWIGGHEDLDHSTVPASDNPELSVRRKRDPGSLFPWESVLNGCGLRRFEP